MNALCRTLTRNLRTMASPTQLLECDPASIAFPDSLDSPALPVISSPSTLDALKLSAHHLLALDDVVAFPTETVYGLGANALSPPAVARIFAAKGRPQDNPLIVHVSSLPMLRRILPDAYAFPPAYSTLMSLFWPGPLTLLFPADARVVPRGVTAGHPSVAVRVPAHPVARALIALADAPLAAPSANASGKPSPTRAVHVLNDLGAAGRVHVILDGGSCTVGLESTVVDGLSTDGHLRVLRPGGVTVEDLERAMQTLPEEGRPRVLVHRRDYEDSVVESAPTTPGMKYRHYSPSVPVTLLMTTSKAPPGEAYVSFPDTLTSLASTQAPRKIGLLAPSDSPLLQHLSKSTGPPVEHFALGARADPATSAARLFDGLLTLESGGADVILVEEISEDNEGLAFMNRARKAAGEIVYVRE
ncbi:translation factor [Phellopilus nigrolimitatus]|nr:translation factor [Phellopilus nigrolimitatus]